LVRLQTAHHLLAFLVAEAGHPVRWVRVMAYERL
jgi:hypothetical protein